MFLFTFLYRILTSRSRCQQIKGLKTKGKGEILKKNFIIIIIIIYDIHKESQLVASQVLQTKYDSLYL